MLHVYLDFNEGLISGIYTIVLSFW